MIAFRVAGIPAPQGSKRAFRNKYTDRIQMIESSKKVGPWRQNVAGEAARHLERPLTRKVKLTLAFSFLRPTSHLTGAGKLRKGAPAVPSPDLDKLIRSTLDGLTGIVIADDKLVEEVWSWKQYGDWSGAEIMVTWRSDD